MKRILCILLSAILALSLTACSGPEEPDNTSTPPQTQPPETTQPQETTQPDAETTEPIVETTAPEAETTVQTEPPKETVDILDLCKTYALNYQWSDEIMLALSEYSAVTVWQEDSQRYPEIAQALKQRATMIERSMTLEYSDLLSFAEEMLPIAPDSFETQVSKMDTQVRRADSVVISLLSDSWSDYGFIDDYRALHGTNYDARTGLELTLSDVLKNGVNQDLAEAVAQELNAHIWAGDTDFTAAVEEFFVNAPSDGISWTLDYNGVTIYFSDGDLEEPGNGCLSATVTFAAYPELFVEEYMEVPDGYMVELPMDHSFFTDLDGDGDPEELNITGWYDSVMDLYTRYGIYTDAAGYYQYEECMADRYLPYYVKTADGRHYVYLFCKQNEGPIPQFELRVIDVSGGQLANVGVMNVGPGYLSDNYYRILTDPESMWLNDFDRGAQDFMEYEIDSNGMPVLKGE